MARITKAEVVGIYIGSWLGSVLRWIMMAAVFWATFRVFDSWL